MNVEQLHATADVFRQLAREMERMEDALRSAARKLQRAVYDESPSVGDSTSEGSVSGSKEKKQRKTCRALPRRG